MSQTPVPPPVPPAVPPQQSQNRTLMLVLAYLYILALVPLLVEKEDEDLQWHAKHGLVITAAEVAIYIVLTILNVVLGQVLGSLVGCGLGCGLSSLSLIVWLVVVAVRIIAILKAMKGERLVLPVITEYANKWK